MVELMLQMAESAEGGFVRTDWADRLLALGARAFRYSSDSMKLATDEQLFIAITVPVRDMAACLIAAGWVLTAPIAASENNCRDLLSTVKTGSLIRIVTSHYLILDEFFGLDGDRVRIGSRTFLIDSVKAATVIDKNAIAVACSMGLPELPGFGPLADNLDEWSRFLCHPPEGLAIIGNKTALVSDLSVCVNRIDRPSRPTPLREVALPRYGRVATWATELISPASLSDDPDETPVFRGAVLDGASAIQSADLVDAPLLIAVMDRSIIDDAAAEFVAQRRNNRGDPVFADIDLGWQPPRGVEVIAFRTRR